MDLNDVPASEPRRPCAANAESAAVVSSMERPVFAATWPPCASAWESLRDVAHGLARAGGEEVGDVAHVAAFEVEHLEGGGGDAGGVGDAEPTGGGEVEGGVESAAEDVGGGDAGFRELLDRGRGFGRGVDGPLACLERGVAEEVHVRGGLVRRGLHVGHLLVEVGEPADGHADADAERGTHGDRGAADLGERLPLLGELLRLGAEFAGLLRRGVDAGHVALRLEDEGDLDGTVGHRHLQGRATRLRRGGCERGLQIDPLGGEDSGSGGVLLPLLLGLLDRVEIEVAQRSSLVEVLRVGVPRVRVGRHGFLEREPVGAQAGLVLVERRQEVVLLGVELALALHDVPGGAALFGDLGDRLYAVTTPTGRGVPGGDLAL